MEPDQFATLRRAGWSPPAQDADGVYYCLGRDTHISYPDGGLESLGLDGGVGYWFEHRARSVRRLLAQVQVTSMWEIGAGTGAMARRLADSLDGGIVAVEPKPEGARACERHGLTSICGTLQDLHLPEGQLNCLGAFDVLEHLPAPDEFLGEARRVLRPGGFLVVTVPAFQWLWGDEDDAVGHFRRYSCSTLSEGVCASGFEEISAEYIFASLVPVALITRALAYRMGRRRAERDTLAGLASQLRVPSFVDRFASGVLDAEFRASKWFPIPFGLSIAAVFKAS